MKIGIVGAGIAGMGAALALSETNQVTVLEKGPRLGGHANTVEVETEAGVIPVDTGFIVFNDRNYPNLKALFHHLGAPTKWSDMSFGYSLDGGALEYACDNLDTIFAQRMNIVKPGVWRIFREIIRFTKVAPKDLASGALGRMSLGEWAKHRGFSDRFMELFLLPMGAAIWSTPSESMCDFPAENFISFFRNHDLLTGMDSAMQWRTVDGGSQVYVARLRSALERAGAEILTGTAVASVDRKGGKPRVLLSDGSEQVFDHLVMATHSDQSLGLLADADEQERNLLGAVRYSQNRAVLHRDTGLMPLRRKAWSSWNFIARKSSSQAAVTYWMNRLQGIDRTQPLFVTLNPLSEPAPDLTIAEFDYAHPIFDQAAFDAQADFDLVQGRGGIWHAGAWLGYGFHEDGLRSGLRVAAALGGRPGWAVDPGEAMRTSLSEAAE